MAMTHRRMFLRVAWVLGIIIQFTGGEVRAMTEQLPGAAPFPAELTRKIENALARRAKGESPRTQHRTKDGAPQFTNRLILESSPYLLQHAHNPVNWYPWGEEAFEVARKSKRPILLSIGYSTCHWCHVMEEESFEDVEIARYLNENYVAIKVDREARPDLDAVYMAAVQSFTEGHGGWPMTVWLTPDRKPFYGGTYFPKDDMLRGGRATPGLTTILRRLRQVADEDPAQVEQVANRVAESLAQQMVSKGGDALPSSKVLSNAFGHYRSAFDSKYAGLRQTTKFPANLPIRFLLRESDRTDNPEAMLMATQTLDAMRKGGIYDQLGGGFHRYSTEPTWTVPHFEKMLYDNALLVVAYLEGYQATGNRNFAAVARDILEYLDREMSSPEGLFYAATDADSEGEEGRFFVWTPAEIRAALGEKLAPLALRAYGATEKGNFEGGRSILRRDLSLAELAKSEGFSTGETEKRLAEIRKKLYSARSKRVAPLTDEKQIVGWNGLAISAFARAGLVLEEPRFTERAVRAAKSLMQRASVNGRLARYLRGGVAHERGVLEDYAYLEAGYLDLFEVTSDGRWFDAALALQSALDELFWDEKGGGYFSSANDAERLLVRQKILRDGALPSGNAVAALNLLRLASLTTDDRYLRRSEALSRVFAKQIEEMPAASGEMLLALGFYFSTPSEVLVVAPKDRGEAAPFVRAYARNFLPNRVFLVASDAEVKELEERVPLLEGKHALGGKVTAYVCENRTCSRPAKDLATFVRQLQRN